MILIGLYDAKAYCRGLVQRTGLVSRQTNDPYVNFIRRYRINVVLDVGANQGQYGRRIMASGFRGNLVSFEPLPEALVKLKANARPHANWQVLPIALGSENKTATINVAGNLQSSSFLPMLSRHEEASPQSGYIAHHDVNVRRLDGMFDEFCQSADCVYLKLDAQGFEQEVLAGAGTKLAEITCIQTEMSIEPLYDGEATWLEMIDFLDVKGFRLMHLNSGFSDPKTGQTLQVEGVFIQSHAVESVGLSEK